VAVPTFGEGTATVEYTVGNSRTYRLGNGRCVVAALDGYSFSVSAGELGGGEFIAVAAMNITLPLAASWTATITGTGPGGTFATLDGVLAFGLGGMTGAFSGETATGESIKGTFTC